jgi:hypothetical protein
MGAGGRSAPCVSNGISGQQRPMRQRQHWQIAELSNELRSPLHIILKINNKKIS